MKKILLSMFVILLALDISSITAQKKESKIEADSLKNISLTGLKFRSIGTAITGGRVRHIVVNPYNHWSIIT